MSNDTGGSRSDKYIKRGFASMDKTKVKEIARLGGIAAHKSGTGHEWTREEASAAGRKGGIASKGGRKKILDGQP